MSELHGLRYFRVGTDMKCGHQSDAELFQHRPRRLRPSSLLSVPLWCGSLYKSVAALTSRAQRNGLQISGGGSSATTWSSMTE